MHHILLENIGKRFIVRKRPEGRFGALRGAFTREKTVIQALSGVNLNIAQGELVGYIGPNGAGKSTTVKIMSGILTPDEGRVEIDGLVPYKQRARHVRRIGVVFGQRSQLWWDTPVRDSFELLRDIYGVSQADYARRVDELCQRLSAGDLLDTPVRQLSLGQRMRCELIAALLHAPEILFLDEPTIGLDAVSKLALREFLREYNRNDGVTMLLTTHDMDDIAALCRRVVVIGRGRALYDGTIDDLRRRYAPQHRLRARLTDATMMPETIEDADALSVADGVLEVRFSPERVSAQALIARLAALCPIADLTVEQDDIDEMIAAMYREMAL